jgi:hypothetical protein
MTELAICPECVAGKHENCTGWAIDADDFEVACGCPTCARPE